MDRVTAVAQGQGGLIAFIQEACEPEAALQLETWIKPVNRLIETWLLDRWTKNKSPENQPGFQGF